MTLEGNGEIVAYYLERDIVCPLCATAEEKARHDGEEGLNVEELDGQVDELWCDRCGARIFSAPAEYADEILTGDA